MILVTHVQRFFPSKEGWKTIQTKQQTSAKLSARQRAVLAARVAADSRGRDVLVLDMRKLVDWVDYLVIVTGSSRRQIKTFAEEVEKSFEYVGDRRIGIAGNDSGAWYVLDFADVVVHLFSDEKRDYYQLEHLWADAERVPWEKEVLELPGEVKLGSGPLLAEVIGQPNNRSVDQSVDQPEMAVRGESDS